MTANGFWRVILFMVRVILFMVNPNLCAKAKGHGQVVLKRYAVYEDSFYDEACCNAAETRSDCISSCNTIENKPELSINEAVVENEMNRARSIRKHAMVSDFIDRDNDKNSGGDEIISNDKNSGDDEMTSNGKYPGDDEMTSSNSINRAEEPDGSKSIKNFIPKLPVFNLDSQNTLDKNTSTNTLDNNTLANTLEKNSISGELFWKMVLSDWEEICKNTGQFLKTILSYGIWFEERNESIDRYPADKIDPETSAKLAKRLIPELLSSKKKSMWINNNCLIVSCYNLIKYCHLGRVQIYPISLRKTSSRDTPESTTSPENISPSSSPSSSPENSNAIAKNEDFEHVLLLRSPFSKNDSVTLKEKQLLLYLIGLLRNGKHIIAAECEQWCKNGFEGVISLVNTNNNLSAITDILASRKLWTNPAVLDSLKGKIDHLEVGISNSRPEETGRLLEFIKEVRPKNVRIAIGANAHDRVFEILDALKGIDILDLSIGRIADFFKGTKHSSYTEKLERFDEYTHIKGLSLLFPYENPHHNLNLGDFTSLLQNLKFLHIKGSDCSHKLFNKLATLEMDALLLDFRHSRPDSIDTIIIYRILHMESLDNLVVLTCTKNRHRNYLRFWIPNVIDRSSKINIILARRRPCSIGKTWLERLRNRNRTIYKYDRLGHDARPLVRMVCPDERYENQY